jgi:predicted alpha/beta-hydrolase family hydrolase
MLAASQHGISEGLLLLSYPLHPPKRPTELRTAHFPSLLTPALFVHGSRDGFGTYEEMVAAARLIPSRTEILEIGSAGHELLTRRNAEEFPNSVVRAFRTFYGA